MKDILFGISLLFLLPSAVQFWLFFIYLEKTKQIILPNDKEGTYVFCKKRRNIK